MLLPGQAKALAAEVVGKGSPILEVSGVVRDWSKMLDLGIQARGTGCVQCWGWRGSEMGYSVRSYCCVLTCTMLYSKADAGGCLALIPLSRVAHHLLGLGLWLSFFCCCARPRKDCTQAFWQRLVGAGTATHGRSIAYPLLGTYSMVLR